MVDNDFVYAEKYKAPDLIDAYTKKYEMQDLINTAHKNRDLEIYNAAILSLVAIAGKIFNGHPFIYLHGSRFIGCSFLNSDVDIIIDYGK